VREECLGEVSSALGRQLMASQGESIEKRVRNQMKVLARADPEAWRAKTYTDRLHEAAAAAAKEMKAEYALKRQRIELTIAAHDRIENFLNEQLNAKSGDAIKAVSRLLDFDTRGGGYTSVQSWYNAVRNEAFSNLIKTWEAIPGNFFGLYEDAQGRNDLWKEIHGEASGNATAKAGADAWKKTTEELRQRFNAAGGQVGKLEDWAKPQHHSQYRVSAAGVEKWIADTMPKLDRSKYVGLDGTQMSDSEVQEFLYHAYDSIITDGLNKQEPGNVAGSGVIANRNSASRQLYFKDAAAAGQYNSLYGELSLPSLLSNHVNRMARDIALTERLGPNSAATFKYFNDRALLDERRQGGDADKLNASAKLNEHLFDAVAGKDQVLNQKIANRFQAFRNWLTAAKLGKVVLTAFSDEAGMMATAFANKIPYTETLLNELKMVAPGESRQFAEHSALGLDAKMGHLNRFAQEDFGSSFSGKMASTVMRLSGAERMWAARRQGMGVTIMSSLGKLTRTLEHASDLTPADHGVIAGKGLTDTTWQVWRRAQPEDWGRSSQVLTPKSIWSIPDEQLKDLGDPTALKREASTQLLAHTLEEAGMGAMDTGPRQRAASLAGTQRGSIGGEMWRSINLFRSFTFSMMQKHWGRAASMPGISKWKYLAPLSIYGTVIAAATNEMRNLLAGEDPDPLVGKGAWQNWGKAAMRGAGLGIFGDFFYDTTTGGDKSFAAAMGGPALGEMEDIYNLTWGAAVKKSQGQRTDEAAKLIRFASGNLPIANMWYTQQAMNHILWNNLQEAASPGYLARMQARQESNFGKSYYWRPGETLPGNIPNFAKAIGQKDSNVSFAGNGP
jgi:hypothetical protein